MTDKSLELADALEKLEESTRAYHQVCQWLHQAYTERDQLRAALEKYGMHHKDCKRWFYPFGVSPEVKFPAPAG